LIDLSYMTQHKGIHKNCFKNFGGGAIARFARSWWRP